jgi:large subunit ribosomal protein L32
MANPKRKSSHSRTAKRRANWKLRQPTFNECPNCGQQKVPHRVCGNCGYYNGREVVETDGL